MKKCGPRLPQCNWNLLCVRASRTLKCRQSLAIDRNRNGNNQLKRRISRQQKRISIWKVCTIRRSWTRLRNYLLVERPPMLCRELFAVRPNLSSRFQNEVRHWRHLLRQTAQQRRLTPWNILWLAGVAPFKPTTTSLTSQINHKKRFKKRDL